MAKRGCRRMSGAMNTGQTATPLNCPLDEPGNVLIEAAAGTGKTYAITTLLVRLVVEEELDLNRILIVTFTKAATRELRERVHGLLRDVQQLLQANMTSGESVPAREDMSQARGICREWQSRTDFDEDRARGRITAALRDFDRANIETIHGFCRRVLEEYAFEARAPFAMQLVADREPEENQVIANTWKRLCATRDEELVKFAIENEFGFAKAREWLRNWKSRPDMKVTGVDSHSGDYRTFLNDRNACLDRARDLWISDGSALADFVIYDEGLNRNRYRRATAKTDMSSLDAAYSEGKFDKKFFELVEKYGLAKITAGMKKGYAVPTYRILESHDDLSEAYQAFQVASENQLRKMKVEFRETYFNEMHRRSLRDRVLGFDDILLELRRSLSDRSGARLAHRLRSRFPVALIDEFQDTDPVQAEIFKLIYESADSSEVSGRLFMVGDPKQSIYQFRGADVYAYVAAARSAKSRLILDTNWRSVPGLVNAVNSMFSIQMPFWEPREIGYTRVNAGKPAGNPLVIRGDDGVPMRIQLVGSSGQPDRQTDDGATSEEPESQDDIVASGDRSTGSGSIREKFKTVSAARSAVVKTVAAEIAHLLHLSQSGEATITEEEQRPVRGSDVAILVRSHDQAKKMASALKDVGIDCVLPSEASVFATREAQQLERFLWALVQRVDDETLRGALTADMFGFTAREMAEFCQYGEAWEEQQRRIAVWKKLWANRGIAAMMRKILVAENGSVILLSYAGGTRRLTNVRHLVDLLQQAETENRLTPYELATWMSGRCENPKSVNSEEQLRLDNDDELVRILTMHGCKGLEFPIVFCPFVWDMHAQNADNSNSREISYHKETDERYEEVLDLDPTRDTRRIALRERFSEQLRLFYVAVTRARYRCILTACLHGYLTKSPLAWFVHPEGFGQSLPTKTDDALLASFPDQLHAFVNRHPELFVAESARPSGMTYRGQDTVSSAVELTARSFETTLRTDRRMVSFSSLTRGTWQHAVTPVVDDDDDAHDVEQTEQVPVEQAEDDRDVFETNFRGSAAGSCVHSILEKLDTDEGGPADLQSICIESLRDYGFATEYADAVSFMVDQTRRVPLKSISGGTFSLAGPHRRIAELEFHFPMRGVRLDEIADCLVEFGYTEARDKLQLNDMINGFLKGYIDLIIEHDERWYVLDYKSNWLGPRLSDYAPDAIADSIRSSGYALQYLIYLVALHRHLGLHVKDYDYERHMGGAIYLYLRGIRVETGMSYGVHFDRPDAQCIDALDSLFRGDHA